MRLLEPDGTSVEVPPEMHSAIKALGNDTAHRRAVSYIIDVVCGRHRLSFVLGPNNTAETTAWLEGRRYVGEMLARMIERPVERPVAEEPRPRTATERQARRARGKP